VVDRIASLLDTFSRDRPTRVAVDGADAAGKTMFADSVALASCNRGRTVVRIGADDFEHPKSHRYRRGSVSPMGCFEDTYDHDSLERLVLQPLANGGGRIVRRVYDPNTDRAVYPLEEDVPADAFVIVDGCFLLRKALRTNWELGLFLQATEAERLGRAVARDAERLGGAERVLARYRARYLPAFKIYLAREDPLLVADVIVDNTEFDHPVFVRWPRVGAT
jgi:uridine kinase